jgi:hypothetical protein
MTFLRKEEKNLSPNGKKFSNFSMDQFSSFYGKNIFFPSKTSSDRFKITYETKKKKKKLMSRLKPLWPGSIAAHKSSTFYWIKLKPWSISSAARKWQITAEMAEMAVLKKKSETQNLGHWTLKKDIG